MGTTTLYPTAAAQYGTDAVWNPVSYAIVIDGLTSGPGPMVGPNVLTRELRLTEIGFTIAPNETLIGLEVRIKRMWNGIDPRANINDYRIQLTCNGSVIGENKATTTQWLYGSLRWDTYGSPSDLWGGLTEAIAQDASFGISIIATTGDPTPVYGSAPALDGAEFIFYTSPMEHLFIPALSGSDSIIGFTRESTYGTTPVSGIDPNKTISNILFLPVKEESINPASFLDICKDVMLGGRKIARGRANGPNIKGSLRFTGGTESLGYILTMIMGTPATTSLAASSGTDEGAFQHIWYNGQRTRTEYPVPYSIESQYAGTRSKLIQGAICNKAAIQLNNNGAMICIPEFIGKGIRWLYPDADDANGSGTTDLKGKTRPAVMTTSPVMIEEPYWHFRQLSAYPQLDDRNYPTVMSIFLNHGFTAVDGRFTAGSGNEIGTYRVDNFILEGRITLLFSTELLFDSFINDDSFKLEFSLIGDTIQGAYANRIDFIANNCKGETEMINKVGTLMYDIPFTALVDSATDKECQFTIVNTVASYA